MEILSSDQRQFFSKTEKKHIFLGEVHGSLQNILLAEEMIGLFSDKKILTCMEWELSAEENGILNEYVSGRRDELPVLPFFHNEGSGRFSIEHREFINHIREMNKKAKNPITIFGFDHDKETWNERDSANAAAIRGAAKDFNIALVCCGNLHARKKEFSEEGERYVPIGSYFAESESIHARLAYESGSLLNYTEDFGVHDALDFKADSDSDSDFFDFKITIEKSDPVHRFNNL